MSDWNQTGPARVKETAEAVVRDKALELFDFAVRPQGGKLLVTVTLDKPEGAVTLDECTAVSRELEARLDAQDLIGTPYLLEVSSPGLDRPLRNLADCLRFKGRLAHVVTREPLAGQTSFRGRLNGVLEGAVELVAEGGKAHWIHFDRVKEARLVVEF
ncbi:MAG TPA: ribosome maturation factor RimP [bacterium]|nr:ribosome maturation factor RimP [bacterium]